MTRKICLFLLVAIVLFSGCDKKPMVTSTYINQDMIYAQVYGVDIGAVPIASSGIYYNVSGTVSDLETGFIFNETGNYELKTLQGGVYKIAAQWSFSGGANTEYHLSVGLNYIQRDQCHAERKIGTGGDVGSASFTCLLALNPGDIINPVIENAESTTDPTINNIQLVLVRVGQ